MNKQRFAAFMFVITVFVFSTFVSTASAQALKNVVRDGSYEDLKAAMDDRSWSSEELAIALIAAAGLNKAPEASLLLARGADPNFNLGGYNSVVIAVRERNREVLYELLENGADPNFRGNFDWTPIHHTVLGDGSFDDAILLLAKHGADVDATTSLKVTTLHRAASFCRPSSARILLEYGANKELRDKYGQTALDRARKTDCPEVAQLLE